MWYDKSQLLSHNKLFNFVLGMRGDGKSYDMKKWIIKDFKKTGAQAVIMRRYRDEIKEMTGATSDYLADIHTEFPDDEITISKKHLLVNGKIAGYFIPLSVSMHFKSIAFPLVNKIIFEEFIIDKGNVRYLSKEVEVFLEFYETIARLRDNVRAVFVANSISVVNPYFLFWNVKLDRAKRFTIKEHIAIEIIKDSEYIQAKKNTRFGKMLEGTTYGKYAIENEFLRDNDIFIEQKTPKASFTCGLKYNGKYYGFWVDFDQGLMYVNEQYDPSSWALYAITKEDHAPNLLLIKELRNARHIKRIVDCFQLGLLRFSDMTVKNQFYELIAFFVR